MSSTTLPQGHVKQWHVIVFVILAGLLALLALYGGLGNLLLLRGQSGFPSDIHRWHEGQSGALGVILFGGSLLALLWRPQNKPLLVAFWLVAVLGTSIITTDLPTLQKALGQVPGLVLFSCIIFLDTISTSLVFALFPTGRFIPSWTRWIVITGGILMMLILVTFPPSSYLWLIPVSLLFFGMISIVFVAQFYRYRYVSSPVQRQQTKWVIFSFIVVLLASLALFVPEWLVPALSQTGSPYQVTNVVSWYVEDLLIALSFGIALLRYRLYDVDILINRTLVYGTLTAILALVYVGCIIFMQYLLRGIIDPNNNVVIVVSTLAIAALFHPLRKRIQAIIDRRFYRRKYDTTHTLAAFSATLRNELDLNQLSEHLVAVVEETMQPTHVSLRLRKTQYEGKKQTRIPAPSQVE